MREAPLRRLVEAVSRAALALVSFWGAIFCRSSGEVEMDLSGIQRAAEKGFDEWAAVEIPRLEALGRPLNEGEKSGLRDGLRCRPEDLGEAGNQAKDSRLDAVRDGGDPGEAGAAGLNLFRLG